jgi:hypothetical protein
MNQEKQRWRLFAARLSMDMSDDGSHNVYNRSIQWKQAHLRSSRLPNRSHNDNSNNESSSSFNRPTYNLEIDDRHEIIIQGFFDMASFQYSGRRRMYAGNKSTRSNQRTGAKAYLQTTFPSLPAVTSSCDLDLELAAIRTATIEGNTGKLLAIIKAGNAARPSVTTKPSRSWDEQ